MNSHVRISTPLPCSFHTFRSLCAIIYRVVLKISGLNLSPQMASNILRNRNHDLRVVLSGTSHRNGDKVSIQQRIVKRS